MTAPLTGSDSRTLWSCLLLWALATGRCSFGASSLEEDYKQWKRARHTNVAAAAANITARPGFIVALVRSARPGEGSWVAMTFDPRGRIVIAREDRGLLRLTLPTPAAPSIHIEPIN